MKVAIMQPYFFPYAGYFRLFSEADLFIIYDCVQFPRRGWVHRNRVINEGKYSWVTLPIKKCPRETIIKDIEFRCDAEDWYEALLMRYALSESNKTELNILKPSGSVVDYLENTLRWSCQKLAIPFNTIRSSDLKINNNLKGQSRILEICSRVGATEYVNSPGGSLLYDSEVFNQVGIELSFLTHFKGGNESILGRYLKGGA